MQQHPHQLQHQQQYSPVCSSLLLQPVVSSQVPDVVTKSTSGHLDEVDPWQMQQPQPLQRLREPQMD
jgi:hypothetical protein